MTRLLPPLTARGTATAAAAAGAVPRLPRFLRQRQPVCARVIRRLCTALAVHPHHVLKGPRS